MAGAACGAALALAFGLAPAVNASPTDDPTPPGSAADSEPLPVSTAPQDAPSASAAIGSADAPQLRITVDNGVTSTTTGDTLTYAITVQNLGSAEVPGLLVTQSMPAGLTFVSADAGGTAKAGSVSWTLDLNTSATATLHTTTTVLATPPELLRLATVACAAPSADAAPTVCATDSDQLPAGAAAQAEAGQATAAQPATAASTGGTIWWYIAGAVVVFLAAVAAVLLTRRHRQRPADGTSQ